VTSADRRQAIAELAGEADWIARGKDPWLSESPVHLVVCVEPDRYRSRYDESDKDPTALDIPWWWVDGGAAMMLGLLAAVDEGLGAGFIGAHAVPGLPGILDLPEEVEPLGIVTVGHPAAHPASRSLRRGRRPSREVIHRETWGGRS
jgi:nitroreductase